MLRRKMRLLLKLGRGS